jgi:hypothetical protein
MTTPDGNPIVPGQVIEDRELIWLPVGSSDRTLHPQDLPDEAGGLVQISTEIGHVLPGLSSLKEPVRPVVFPLQPSLT